MGLILKFILISIALSWIFSSLLRFFLKSKFKVFINKVNEAQQEETRKQRKEGEIKVDYIPKNQNQKTSNNIQAGEYVDYEEVKE
ncbi:DUF4834 domain-containing protein [Echinicola jeungdonensis]|uniref:DUF4834 domain-containing protein n=1 Tax=Echinicola jeungdonensis TaxID=709343 RepID=A0ABV5J610_9BACT|nr:DUF4834 domain-containing protein [Echinicola jeungdonensis]MDN3668769.1 DUF4834 domain-containing protein [Echinicola jeungdonensis]